MVSVPKWKTSNKDRWCELSHIHHKDWSSTYNRLIDVTALSLCKHGEGDTFICCNWNWPVIKDRIKFTSKQWALMWSSLPSPTFMTWISELWVVREDIRRHFSPWNFSVTVLSPTSLPCLHWVSFDFSNDLYRQFPAYGMSVTPDWAYVNFSNIPKQWNWDKNTFTAPVYWVLKRRQL